MADREVVACVGAGRMGRGIALVFAYAGHEVRLCDAKIRDDAAFHALAEDALGDIEHTLDMLASLGMFDAAATPDIVKRIRIHPRGEARAALAGAKFVFEGVPEVMEAKREVFALIDAAADADAVIASTTSTFLVTALAEMVGDPRRFLNAHWLNPAYLVPLVELSPGPDTAREVVDRLRGLLEAVGKKPVECSASPGYIVPRIQALAMNEAARMVEEGVATAADIDTAVRFGFGFRFANMGLLEFVDWGGGDILYYASRYLAEATGDDRFRAPEIVERNMKDGRTGMKTGRGFYDFSDLDIAAYQRETLGRFVALLRHMGLARPPETGT